MRKRLGIVGFVVPLVLAAAAVGVVAWWGNRAEGPCAPALGRDASSQPATGSAPPEYAKDPTLAGAPRPAPPVADRGSVLTGRVVRRPSHASVAGADVVLRWGEREVARTRTSVDGRFRLDARAPAASATDEPPPVLVASAEGLTTLQAIPAPRGRLPSGDVGDLVLEPALTIRGVVRGEDGEIVVGAHIVVEPARPSGDTAHRAGSWAEAALHQHVESDAEGRFAFTGLPPRRFDLEVRAEGYVSAWYRGSAVADAAWLDVRLLRGQPIAVRVEDFDGRPLAGARVNLYLGYRTTFAGHYKTHLRLDRSTTTDAAGRCVLTGLRDRNHLVTAQHHGLAGAATYVLPGWSETVVRLTPGWRSTRYVFEAGPGDSGSGAFAPWQLSGPYAWVRWPPEPDEPATPAEPAASPSVDAASEPAEEEAPAARPPPPSDRARLHVTVLSAEGIPMPRVYVGFEGPEEEALITEEDGTDVVSVAPGRYAVRVSPLDFGTPAADVHETVDAQGGVESHFRFRLPLVHAVDVQVRSADGKPVPRAEIRILRNDDKKTDWVDADGRTRLFAERGQPFALFSREEGYPAAFLERVTLPAVAPVVLRVPAQTGFRGRVLGPEGTPVFGAFVEVCREGLGSAGEEDWNAWTDDRGEFVLEGPAPARYEIRARHRAFGAAIVRVDIGPALEPVALRLVTLTRLRGRVVDEQGAPIGGAEIEVRVPNRDRGYGWVGSGDDGRFAIGLPLGDAAAELVVERKGFATQVVPVETAVQGEQEIRLVGE